MTNIWLGAEYNANYKDEVSTDALMQQYLKHGSIAKNTTFFVLLEAQVRVFGDPADFHYDDVSCIKAGGKHTETLTYEQHVIQSVDHHRQLFASLHPELVLIGGGKAFDAWTKYVLPKLDYDRLTVVKLRNPSRQAHWGSRDAWLAKYRSFQADLPKEQELTLMHLMCSNLDSPFELKRVPR